MPSLLIRPSGRLLSLALAGVAAGLLAACGGTSTSTTTGSGGGGSTAGPGSSATLPPPVSPPPSSGLPFHFDGSGQGGSGPFVVSTAGDYKVAWTISGMAGGSPCTVSIGLSSASAGVTVVDGVQVGPTDKKDGTSTVHLDAGTYRAVEGGGCGWSLTVGA